MRWDVIGKILWTLFVAHLPTQVYSQTTQEELPLPPAPLWDAAAGQSSTPDGACRLAHQYFNPGAPYSPPTYISDAIYGCSWLARQAGGPPEAGTVLPNLAFGGCPGGYELSNGMCRDSRTDSTICDCGDPARGIAAPPTPMIGNPVSVTTGYKVHDELDYSTADGLFQVKRRHVSTSYRGWYFPQLSFGENWQGLIPGRLIIHANHMADIAWIQGNGESFHKFASANRSDDYNWDYNSPGGTRATLSMVSTPSASRSAFFQQAAIPNGPAEFRLAFRSGGYILFRRATAQSERRSAVPIERGYADGYKQYFDYEDTGLFPYRIRDSFSRQMLLSWVDTPRSVHDVSGVDPTIKAIKTIALPDATTLTYDYDKANWQATGSWTDTGGAVATVTMPGRKDRLAEVRRTNAAGQLIWKRTYLYENNRWPYALTGIRDQAGTRLSTYSYNASGLVASSERSGGVDRHTFRQFRPKTNGFVEESYLYHEVTNPLGHKETYKLYRHPYWMPPQVPRLILQVDGEVSLSVPADTKSLTYADDTTVTSLTDKKGILTAYSIDTANSRPISITEAQGTPHART